MVWKKADKRAKRRIYIRNFACMAVACVLMLSVFSGYYIKEQKKVVSLNFRDKVETISSFGGADAFCRSYNEYKSGNIKSDKLENIGNNIYDAYDIAKQYNIAFALYDGSYEPVWKDTDYSFITFKYWEKHQLEKDNIHTEMHTYQKSLTGVCDLSKYFTESQVSEIEKYGKYYDENAKIGKIQYYSLSMDELWSDGFDIIPLDVTVTPIYVTSDDENGKSLSENDAAPIKISSTLDADSVSKIENGAGSGYVIYPVNSKLEIDENWNIKNDEYLKSRVEYGIYRYYNEGYFESNLDKLNESDSIDNKYEELRKSVTNKENFRKNVNNFLNYRGAMMSEDSSQNRDLNSYMGQFITDYCEFRSNGLLSYTITRIRPVENNYSLDGLSDGWGIYAMEVGIWDIFGRDIMVIWISVLLLFFAIAWLMSHQSYMVYLAQEKNEENRRSMTNALAHDIKTPLAAVSGYADMIAENLNEDKRVYYAEKINQCTDRMDGMLRQMTEISKLESTEIKLVREDFSLAELSQEVTDRFDALCETKQVVIDISGDSEINADRELMSRVLDNFISNAVKNAGIFRFDAEKCIAVKNEICVDDASGNEMEIVKKAKIQVEISDGKWQIFNSGSHIDESKLKEIWKPYTKADDSRGENDGAGLGLYIVKTILDMHGFGYGVENVGDLENGNADENVENAADKMLTNGVRFWFEWK